MTKHPKTEVLDPREKPPEHLLRRGERMVYYPLLDQRRYVPGVSVYHNERDSQARLGYPVLAQAAHPKFGTCTVVVMDSDEVRYMTQREQQQAMARAVELLRLGVSDAVYANPTPAGSPPPDRVYAPPQHSKPSTKAKRRKRF